MGFHRMAGGQDTQDSQDSQDAAIRAKHTGTRAAILAAISRNRQDHAVDPDVAVALRARTEHRARELHGHPQLELLS